MNSVVLNIFCPGESIWLYIGSPVNWSIGVLPLVIPVNVFAISSIGFSPNSPMASSISPCLTSLIILNQLPQGKKYSRLTHCQLPSGDFHGDTMYDLLSFITVGKSCIILSHSSSDMS